jgi:molybdate transport system regulatory protein
MRNQFPCTVGTLSPQSGQVRVQLRLADGNTLHARVTRESAQLLGLMPGLAVLALCKATAVTVAARFGPTQARNRLEGQVTRASRAAAGGEVGIRLPGGVRLVGFAGPGHGLRVGMRAVAAVDETAVVIALPD